MLWVKKTKKITPIPSGIERKLLQNAYNKQPNNKTFFTKLIESHLHESSLDDAIKVCEKHLDTVAKSDYVFASLIQIYRKLNDIENLIQIAELAISHHPKIDTQLHLACAYAHKNQLDIAHTLMPNNDDFIAMDVSLLRLALQTYLLIKQPQKATDLYSTLSKQKQSDSGLKSDYIKALALLDKQTELAKLLDYSSLIKQYQLYAVNESLPIKMVNDVLSDFLSSHSKQFFEPGNHTAKCGSQMHFETNWHTYLYDLEEQIKPIAERYLENSALLEAATKHSFTIHFWANVLNQGGHQISHIHPDALLSGVYYLKVPKSISRNPKKNNYQGCLLFKQDKTDPYYIQPKDGLLVLFPSYFYHQTIPLKHHESRVCIAFDVVKENTAKTI